MAAMQLLSKDGVLITSSCFPPYGCPEPAANGSESGPAPGSESSVAGAGFPVTRTIRFIR